MNFFLLWIVIVFSWFLSLISIMYIISTFWDLNNLENYENFKFPIISIYVITFSTLISLNLKYFLEKKNIIHSRKLIFDNRFIIFTAFIFLKLTYLKNLDSNLINYIDIIFFIFLLTLYFFFKR